MAFSKKAYLESGGTICPFCSSTHWTCREEPVLYSPDQTTGYSDMICLDCGAQWRDIFKLVDVIVLQGPNGR